MSSTSLVRPGLTTAIVGHLPAIKSRLRKKVAQLTFVDVRRARLPLYEALVSDLYESGYINAAYLLLELIEFEHDHVPQTSDPAIERKRLKNSKKHLMFLFESLRDAEGCMKEQQYEMEVEHLLKVGRWFLADVQKRWLGRQFFLISFDRCRDTHLEESRVGAVAKHDYAMFLLTMGQFKEATELLESARSQAVRQNWTVDIGDSKKLLINEIYGQLFLAYSLMSEHFKKTNSHMYEHFLRLSHECAIQSNLDQVICESCMQFGDFLLEMRSFDEALENFQQASKKAKRIKAKDIYCKSNVRMVALYSRMNEPCMRDNSREIVQNLTADDKKSECYAELLLLTSEMYLENGRTAEAIEGLREALEIYKHLRNEAKIMQICCLEASVSTTGSTFGQFVDMVRDAECYGPVSENQSLFKLLRWTTDGEPFW
ncbi:uncharacterized protein LOC129771903 [Toxorhynchites rutilus septentrionalis]|uniref:uncharacterized protein LOC129771903 n=1 Tax=Toxorhynchites rutilus septentrionalis TaxID=329112 RepID=UPI00247AFAB6|nr:uncharacterized protein LOC129771903 [Toxorhynchites rutilus septentrionalis]